MGKVLRLLSDRDPRECGNVPRRSMETAVMCWSVDGVKMNSWWERGREVQMSARLFVISTPMAGCNSMIV